QLFKERSATHRKCSLEEIKLPLPKAISGTSHGRGEYALLIIDGNDDGTERLKTVQDYGIDVNFVDIDSDDEQEVCIYSLSFFKDGSPEALAEFNSQIAKLTAEIKCIAPNFTKAMERSV
ncbi:hypothetical protein DFH05DRAFT_1408695, partial [Lentinula detonsa]